ncbi:hypothetical protein SKAU_G00111140 [Synaphobranchus kaupii]|uniref:Uncharacterized protein n=1 Tax=Synaphobranchus kaupii TaxID=118154 RepID=A0A9Q1J8C2_SYNKA|nr:hypothetical protein SKAU_G00111140 [Synaphobranchus kaupii]
MSARREKNALVLLSLPPPLPYPGASACLLSAYNCRHCWGNSLTPRGTGLNLGARRSELPPEEAERLKNCPIEEPIVCTPSFKSQWSDSPLAPPTG